LAPTKAAVILPLSEPLGHSTAGRIRLINTSNDIIGSEGEKRNAYRLLVGNPEGKRPLGRPRHRWVDNINNIINH
jgi:hypothetical protein